MDHINQSQTKAQAPHGDAKHACNPLLCPDAQLDQPERDDLANKILLKLNSAHSLEFFETRFLPARSRLADTSPDLLFSQPTDILRRLWRFVEIYPTTEARDAASFLRQYMNDHPASRSGELYLDCNIIGEVDSMLRLGRLNGMPFIQRFWRWSDEDVRKAILNRLNVKVSTEVIDASIFPSMDWNHYAHICPCDPLYSLKRPVLDNLLRLFQFAAPDEIEEAANLLRDCAAHSGGTITKDVALSAFLDLDRRVRGTRIRSREGDSSNYRKSKSAVPDPARATMSAIQKSFEGLTLKTSHRIGKTRASTASKLRISSLGKALGDLSLQPASSLKPTPRKLPDESILDQDPALFQANTNRAAQNRVNQGLIPSGIGNRKRTRATTLFGYGNKRIRKL